MVTEEGILEPPETATLGPRLCRSMWNEVKKIQNTSNSSCCGTTREEKLTDAYDKVLGEGS